jgi:hypothetical protein
LEGVLVAIRRRVVESAPAELLVFRPDDWMSPMADVSAFEAWLRARFEWARTHPDDFSLGGDVLDMLRERVAYRRGLLP